MTLRLFEIMNETDKIDLVKVRAWLDKIACNYAIFLHDKDETRPHYHIMVRLGSPWDLNRIATSCGVPVNYIEKGKTTFKKMIQYGFHLNASNKYQYNEDCVIGSNFDYTALLHNSDSKGDDPVMRLIKAYAEHKITQTELNEQLTWEDYNSHKKDIDNAKTYRNRQIGGERDMKVCYVTGASGSGKTTFAKYLGKALYGRDVFVTGAGADPFDGYDCEQCVILDEMRADVFKKHELFKLLDNNTESKVHSRYYDKALRFCKLLIITSVKRPEELYNWAVEEALEPSKQFIRRLGNVYVLVQTDGDVYECHIKDDFHVDNMRPYPVTMDTVFKFMGYTKDPNGGPGAVLRMLTATLAADAVNDKLIDYPKR